MATCQFCGRQFRNAQAVRAHLKACPAYLERDQTAGSTLGSVALGTVPEAPGAGTELTDGEVDREGQREAARQRAQERADRQALRETEEFLRRAEAERRARQRRELIQSVKEETVGRWSWQHPTIPAEVKAEALQEIERKLSRLPLDELPRHEVVQIAEGVRDRLFRPVLEAQEAARQRARAQEEEARQRARAEQEARQKAEEARRQAKGEEEEARRRAKVVEEAARRREEEAARERADAKGRLLEHGMSVADEELRADEDLDPRERGNIRSWMQSVLEEELSGAESKEEVAGLVDDILDEEFGEDDDEDEDGEGADDFDEDHVDADDE